MPRVPKPTPPIETDRERFEREEREERELLERRGVGIGRVSRRFHKGLQLGLALIQAAEELEGPTASLDRQFRDGPQANFALPFLKRLRAWNCAEVETGFAAVLSEVIQDAVQYKGSDHLEELIAGAEITAPVQL